MEAIISIWIATSIAGLVLALIGVREAWLDLLALRELPRNGRWMIARHQLLRYLLRAGICASFLAAAVFADHAIWLLVLSNVLLLVIALSEMATAAFLRRGVKAKLELEEQTGND